MAYLVASSFDKGTSITSLPQPFPSGIQEDDLILVLCRCPFAVPSITGYSTAVAMATGTGSYYYLYKVAGASETAGTVSFTASNNHMVFTLVIRGADTTTPIESETTSTATAAKLNFPRPTPPNADSLLLFVTPLLNNFRQVVFEPGMREIYSILNASANGMSVAMTQHRPASTQIPQFCGLPESTTNQSYTGTVLVINDDGSGDVGPYVDMSSAANRPAVPFNYLLGSGTSGDLTDGGVSDPTTLVPAVRNGTFEKDTFYNANVANGGDVNPSYAGLSAGGVRLGSGAGNTDKVNLTLSSVDSADLSGSIISVTSQGTGSGLASFNQIGRVFGVTDGTDSRLWQILASDSATQVGDGKITCVIELEGGQDLEITDGAGTVTNNSPTLSACTGVLYGTYYPSATFSNDGLTQCNKLQTMIMAGGSASVPCSFKAGFETANGMVTKLGTVQGQLNQATGQFLVAQDMQIGGADSVYWKSSNQSAEWPAAYGNERIQFSLTSAALELTVDVGTGDTIDLSSTTLNFGDFHKLTLAATTGATWVTDGLVVLNSTVTLADVGSTLSGITFSGCKTITGNADLSGGCTISNSADDHAIVVTSQAEFENLQNCTFSGNNYSIQITGNHGGETWSGAGISISGRTGSFDIQYTGTGTLTINADAGQSWAGEATVGTLTIAATPLTLTINSDTADTLIRYFANDSQTVADSATGTTLGYEYSTSDPVDVELVKQSYVPVNRQDVTPYDGNFDVVMDFDEAYNASHGLTITTEFDYNRSTKALTINSDQDALAVRSALADVIRTNSGYYNTPLLMVAIPGLTRVDLTDGMTITDMATWKGAGMERYDAADSSNPVEKWCHVKSVGDITGATVHYRQTGSGDSTAITLTNNVVDEALQYWRDDNHDGDTADTDEFDYSGHLVIKSFLAGSKQGRVDVLANAGITALQSSLYTVPLTNEAHDYAGSDPGISADLTIVAGGTVGGKAFAYKIVDGGTNTGANIADQLNYNAANNPNAVVPGGTGLRYFELPDMVIHNTGGVETERGYREGASPALVGFYVERGGSDHPDFTRFQADDGTYYTPASSLSVINSNLLSGTRVQVYNVTQDAELYNGALSGSGLSEGFLYGPGQEIEAGDVVRYRATYQSGTTYKLPIEGTAVASGGNIQFTDTQSDWDAVDAWNIDGSGVTEFTADGANIDIDLDDPDGSTTKTRLGAWWAYYITTELGIRDFFGAYEIPQSNVIRQVVSVLDVVIHNTGTLNVRFTDNDVRYYRSDNSLPYDTTGNSIFMDYTGVPDVVETGVSGLTTSESNQLSDIHSKTDGITFSKANEVDVNIVSVNDVTVSGAGTEAEPWGPAS